MIIVSVQLFNRFRIFFILYIGIAILYTVPHMELPGLFSFTDPLSPEGNQNVEYIKIKRISIF